MAETKKHLGRSSMVKFFRDIGPFLNESILQSVFGGVVLGTIPGLKNGPHRNVHGIQVRATYYFTKSLNICFSPVLHPFCSVRGCPVLAEDISGIIICVLKPGKHLSDQLGLLDVLVDLHTLLNEI
uniref:Uncharacterized protein n=1 Tax=Lepeophtheirus salmonis TaxID=72036 RepID=A0A0K2U371_LEPSM